MCMQHESNPIVFQVLMMRRAYYIGLLGIPLKSFLMSFGSNLIWTNESTRTLPNNVSNFSCDYDICVCSSYVSETHHACLSVHYNQHYRI